MLKKAFVLRALIKIKLGLSGKPKITTHGRLNKTFALGKNYNNYRPRTKYDGKVMFLVWLFLHWGVPSPLALGPFRGSSSPVTGPVSGPLVEDRGVPLQTGQGVAPPPPPQESE